MFRGKVQIEEVDPKEDGNYYQWLGKYECRRCTIQGVQIVSADKAKFPDGVSDEDVAHSMLDLINVNHNCLALDNVAQIRKQIDKNLNDKAAGRILH